MLSSGEEKFMPPTATHPAAAPSSQSATPPLRLANLNNTRVTVTIDPDILLACEDQAKSQMKPLQEWFQESINYSLRAYLGL